AVFANVTPALASGRPSLRLVKRLWGVGEVQVVEGGRVRTLARFPEPIQVEESEVSPDGRRALLWYRVAHSPLKLSLYDLGSLRRTADITPGFGGDLHFAPAGTVVHRWGCG